VKDQNLLGDAVTVEIFKALVEVPKAASENGFLARARKLSVECSKLDARAVELKRVAAIGKPIDPERSALKPLNDGDMAVDINNLHVFNPSDRLTPQIVLTFNNSAFG
jgi:hypothetical protein